MTLCRHFFRVTGLCFTQQETSKWNGKDSCQRRESDHGLGFLTGEVVKSSLGQNITVQMSTDKYDSLLWYGRTQSTDWCQSTLYTLNSFTKPFFLCCSCLCYQITLNSCSPVYFLSRTRHHKTKNTPLKLEPQNSCSVFIFSGCASVVACLLRGTGSTNAGR